MFDPPANDSSSSDGASESRPKILYLGGGNDARVQLKERLGGSVDVVPLSSSHKALDLMGGKEYAGVYADADYFSAAIDVGRLLQNDRILAHMPDGVVLLDANNTIIWGNGRLREWTDRGEVVGQNFYQVMGGPEIMGPDFCPFHTALSTRKSSGSVLRRTDNRYFRVHAAPLLESGEAPQHLVVTVHDITEEVLQQQKLAAIHQAGVQLADLAPDDVAELDYNERVALLKDNILHCMQDVLKLDVIEIRMLDQETRELKPLMAVGMEPEAERRRLYASKQGNGVTGYVAATGESYVCGNAAEDPLYLEGAKGARSSLTAPLVLHEHVIGTLNVESPEADAFSESDLQFLEIFARNVAMALNTLELLAAEKAAVAAASVEAIHAAVALPVDDILNDAVNVMEQDAELEPAIRERLQKILRNARDIKRVIQRVGRTMAPVQAYPTAPADAHPLLEGRRILVVDADESVRMAAHELLDRYRCYVETAHDGGEARKMVRSLAPDQRYDVIISDIRLPDMTGYELLLKLREITDRVPLVLMTGFGWDRDHTIVKARREGLQYVLYKPFRLDQLVSAIEHTVDEQK
ncbi:MAG: two-component system response regulator [Planctomycetota bacterium]|nr:MAG: two-component system response regulator [Planctomycetota bacterium]